MNCATTLEQLDCVRPNSDDLNLPEFADARAHWEQCESCRIEFARRQQIDGVIAHVIQQVAVPSDPRLKLLAEFSPRTVKPQSRFKQRWRVTVLASCLVLMLGIVFWPRQTGTFAIGEALSRLSVDVAQSSPFDGGFVPPSPFEWSSIELSRELRGQDLDGVPGHEAAVRIFRFDSRRGHVVQGLLVTIPANRVSPAPAADRFNQASPRYPSFSEQRFAAAAWLEGAWVYVCLIPDHPGDLELLQRATQGTAA